MAKKLCRVSLLIEAVILTDPDKPDSREAFWALENEISNYYYKDIDTHPMSCAKDLPSNWSGNEIFYGQEKGEEKTIKEFFGDENLSDRHEKLREVGRKVLGDEH